MVKLHLVLASMVTVSFALYAPKYKNGDCPITIDIGFCSDCSSDYDCQGSKKCCHSSIGQCSSYCVLPVFGGMRRGSAVNGDTVEVITRRVQTSGGGGILHGDERSSTGRIIGGGSPRVIGTIDVGRVSEIRGVGGILGKKVAHVADGSIDELIGGGDGLVGGTRTVIETVRVGAGVGGVANRHIVGGNPRLSEKAFLRATGGAGLDRRVGGVGSLNGRSGSGTIRRVTVLDDIPVSSGVIRGTSKKIGY